VGRINSKFTLLTLHACGKARSWNHYAARLLNNNRTRTDEMPRGGGSKNQDRNLPATIMGQIGSESNTRYLHSLPVFRVDPELPEEMLDRLGDLERAENRTTRRER
jgi:hypothetical protein